MTQIIIFADTFWPPVKGGCEILASGLASQFYKMGYNTTVVASYKGARDRSKTEIVNGVEVTRFNYSIPKYVAKHILSFPIIFPLSFIQLLIYFRQKKPDLIIQSYLASNSFYLLCVRWFGWFFGVPNFFWIACPQGSDIQERPRQFRFHRWMIKKVFEEADYISGASAYVLSEAEKFVPSVREKSRVIWTPIALEDFTQYTRKHEHPKPYILCVGRWVWKKAQDSLILAYKKIMDDYTVDLILVGFGEEEDKLRELAKGFEDRIHFVDGKKLTREETIEYFNGALISTIPSRLEVFGQTGPESLAAGKPLLATFVDGIPEVLGTDKKYGFTQNAYLVDCSVDGIEQGLRDMLGADKRMLDDMAERGREFVFNRYSYQKACEEYLKVWEAIEK